MGIVNGSTADSGDFIIESERNTTPANDSGRVPQLESDGKVDSFFLRAGVDITYGETLNGATLPVPTYIDSATGKVLACDGNDTTKIGFRGFALENGVLNDIKKIRAEGIVGGFSGLTAGLKYYVQDAVGTIGTTVGTYEVLVGIAISATEIIIMPGGKFASGTTTFSTTTTTTITTGFRPNRVTIFAVAHDGGTTETWGGSQGGWTPYGGNSCIYFINNDSTGTAGGAGTSATAWKASQASGSAEYTGIIDTLSDTGFRLNSTKTGSPGGSVQIYWTAEGNI